MMTLFVSNTARDIDKFNQGNFNLWNFKIKILLASIDLWDIVDKFKETSPSNADPKVKKQY